MDAFSAQQLAQLRTRLLQMQAELNEQLQISKQATDVVELDQTMVGRVSRMDAMQQQSMALSTREKANLKLDEVKTALRTMTGDDYGYCRRCDDLIAFQRLLARPEARLCITCQDRADRRQ